MARLRPKSSRKISVWATRGPIYGPKTHVVICTKMGQNGKIEKKTFFSKLAIKWAKQGVFICLRVYLESQTHNEDIGNG